MLCGSDALGWRLGQSYWLVKKRLWGDVRGNRISREVRLWE